MKSCRELIHHVVTFTRNQHGPRTVKWRFDLARKNIAILRFIVSVLEFESSKFHAWKTPALTEREKRALISVKAAGDNNERALMVLAMFLRSTIGSHIDYLDKPLHVNQELKMYACVSELVRGYHCLSRLIDTQFPFPLAQMNRTFIVIWVFTLPMVLFHDSDDKVSSVVATFFLTYAFIGLELVSVELDDPFGDDVNNFDILGLAKKIFEDVYICIHDIDGEEASQRLREYFYVQEKHDYDADDRATQSTVSSSARVLESSPLAQLCASNTGKRKRYHKRINSDDALRRSSMIKSPDAGDEMSKLLRHDLEINGPQINLHHYDSVFASSEEGYAKKDIGIHHIYSLASSTS